MKSCINRSHQLFDWLMPKPKDLGERYHIKVGYKCNLRPLPSRDSVEEADLYQHDVYRYAAEIAQRLESPAVVDVGCGYGTKLLKYLSPIAKRIVGIDGSYAIDYCMENHATGTWVVDDIECPTTDPGLFDLIVSADVIEHLVYPDRLLDWIKDHSTPDTLIVISTPERDLRRGKLTQGPPPNRAHVREWNSQEFTSFLIHNNLDVLEHRIMDLKAGMRTCQTVLCRTKPNVG